MIPDNHSTARRVRIGVTAGALALSLAACDHFKDPDPQPSGPPQPDGSIAFLEQGWSPELRELFYYTPQGSHLMPYDWFLALEQAGDRTGEQTGNEARFAAPAHLAGYGFLLPTDASALNPGALPVGFAKEPPAAPGLPPSVGLTCAACHTNDVIAHDQILRIDGAPTLADFDSFVADLYEAVAATHPKRDPARFGRFATRLLGHPPSPEEAAQLGRAYTGFAIDFLGRNGLRFPPLASGPGRVDALGQIVNALSVIDMGEPENFQPPSAPVSYPFLWYTPKLDWVQWNPIASSPMGRNAGEALGVFGHSILQGPPETLLTSTVRYHDLFKLEQWVDALTAPPWPADKLGAVDGVKAAAGAELFGKYCRGCHNMPPFTMTAPEENIIGKQFVAITKVNYRAVGTDPTYVQSLASRFSKSGNLAPVLFGNAPVVPTGALFLRSVGAIVKRGLAELGLTPQQQLAYNDFRFYPPATPDAEPQPYKPTSLEDLKAGPLLGIWATAPFLHNGSVPNLYELLSPPEERSKVFWVGNRRLDPDKMGFVAEEEPNLFRFDTSKPGNGNGGHVFPKKGLTPDERLAIIEFLKDPRPYLETAAR